MSKNKWKWHPYPREKPSCGGYHRVLLINKGKIYKSGSTWFPKLNMFFVETDRYVVAWAAPPELCEETNDSERAN